MRIKSAQIKSNQIKWNPIESAYIRTRMKIDTNQNKDAVSKSNTLLKSMFSDKDKKVT